MDDFRGSSRAARAIRSRRGGSIGDPDEIAAAFGFLASDEASSITGHTLVADGGRLVF